MIDPRENILHDPREEAKQIKEDLLAGPNRKRYIERANPAVLELLRADGFIITPDTDLKRNMTVISPPDPREELKERLRDIGYSYEYEDYMGMTMVKFTLPKGQLSITIKQAGRKPIADIKALIEAAMNQDEIKKGLPVPTVERESDME